MRGRIGWTVFWNLLLGGYYRAKLDFRFSVSDIYFGFGERMLQSYFPVWAYLFFARKGVSKKCVFIDRSDRVDVFLLAVMFYEFDDYYDT